MISALKLGKGDQADQRVLEPRVVARLRMIASKTSTIVLLIAFSRVL